MINCMCVIQEGQAPDHSSVEIKALLNRFTTTSFGQEAQIAWIPVGPGNGFTAGKPSTSSVVAITADKPLNPTRRESLLRELVDQWTHKTGCTIDEIVAVISDPVDN